jgi:hypothetical protein
MASSYTPWKHTGREYKSQYNSIDAIKVMANTAAFVRFLKRRGGIVGAKQHMDDSYSQNSLRPQDPMTRGRITFHDDQR